MTRRPLARYLLHARCRGCQRGYFAASPALLPPCPGCGLERWRVLAVWDICRQAWPTTLSRRKVPYAP